MALSRGSKEVGNVTSRILVSLHSDEEVLRPTSLASCHLELDQAETRSRTTITFAVYALR